MLGKGAIIVYGTQICRVSDVKDMTFGKVTRKYYILTPVWDDKNILYVPTDNQALTAKMKRILNEEEIYSLVHSIPSREIDWIDDDKERAQKFRDIIGRSDREEVIGMIKALFERKTELEASGKKLHAADAAMLDRAEKIICEEFALVLNIKKEDVASFIAREIEVKEKDAIE